MGAVVAAVISGLRQNCTIRRNKHTTVPRDCGYGKCESGWATWECQCSPPHINTHDDIKLPCIYPCENVDCGEGMG